MDHEIWRGNELLERLAWTGPAWQYPTSEEAAQQRAELRARAVARAYELGGLAFERYNPNCLESDHTEFRCRERSETEVEVETPVGTFVLEARRARAGEHVSSVTVARSFGGAVGLGRAASKDQLSPPVAVDGRLNPPVGRGTWTFQPSCFVYADGTSSDFLGAYPRRIVWDEEPVWPVE